MPNTEKLVTISRLKALLDAYGAAPHCWPEEERTAATALIETSSEARRLVEEAAALDALLDNIPEPEVSAALTSRVRSMAFPIIEARSIKARSNGLFARLADFLRPRTPRAWQGAVAMAGVLGMVAGIGLSPMVFDRTGPTPQVVATAAPLTSEVVETITASLAPNVNTISLTGEEMVQNISEETGQQSDAGEFTIAGVPLY
ncbi:MAG: hypothetical protein O3C34_18760 [Proteobacteria bacterium]|nr:hypothetical protein [Pseudomonadota bacterium]